MNESKRQNLRGYDSQTVITQELQGFKPGKVSPGREYDAGTPTPSSPGVIPLVPVPHQPSRQSANIKAEGSKPMGENCTYLARETAGSRAGLSSSTAPATHKQPQGHSVGAGCAPPGVGESPEGKGSGAFRGVNLQPAALPSNGGHQIRSP